MQEPINVLDVLDDMCDLLTSIKEIKKTLVGLYCPRVCSIIGN